MSLLLELASNKAKARAAAKELTVAQLENLIAGFTNALDKVREEENARLAEEAEKAARAEEIALLIAKSGLTMEEVALLSTPKNSANKGKTVEPKYRLEVNGEVHEWTGRGRTPKVFQEYFDAGNSRESVEIK
ncbi:H-NS family nucleoid-associated regulatory protein [Marinomonas pollencensis]|uniref:DNA-binding protein n=1 Tax=Marinomonas pollencensis TaxID=491954 RepID=A0A3E0DJ47_9GAMM|nr:H-NS family nucleoid-associated regulatory protein [Marinomonas pollencensis]REG82697.1 DNA-binding protein H-NS/DNA-binding protein StpA [Marinomonas pollencensis]